MKQKLLLGLVALSLLAGSSHAETGWERFTTSSSDQWLVKRAWNLFQERNFSLFGAKYHKNNFQVRKYSTTAEEPQPVHSVNAHNLLITAVLTKAATTFLNSNKNSGKDLLVQIVKPGGCSALAGLLLMAGDTSELWAQECVRSGNKTRFNQGAFRFTLPVFARALAMAFYFIGQNDLHPLQTTKNVWNQGILQSFKALMTKKHSLHEIANLLANNLIPLYYAYAEQDVRWHNDPEAAAHPAGPLPGDHHAGQPRPHGRHGMRKPMRGVPEKNLVEGDEDDF